MSVEVLEFLSQDFMPHGHCYFWRPSILWTNVIADAVIAAAYFSIPAALIYIRKKRQDMIYPSLFILFSLFILLCGLTHLYSIYTIWVGSYGIHGVIKAATAIISLTTAVVLASMLPKIIKTPTIDQLKDAVDSANKEKLDRLAIESQFESEKSLREAANASPVGLMVVAEDGTITMGNDALCHLFGYAPGELVGENVSILIETGMHAEHVHLIKGFFESKNDSRAMASGRIVYGVHKSGCPIPIEIKLIKKTGSGVSQVFAAVSDMSEKLADQEILAKANRRFERITSASQEGLWEWHLESNSLWWSPTFWQLLGYKKEPAEINMGLWEAHVHEEDRARLFSAIDRHVSQGDELDIEFRSILVDRQVRWFQARGKCVTEASDKNRYMCGTIEDIQRRKDLDMTLAEKNQFLESVFAGASYGLYVMDCAKDGTLTFATANPHVEQNMRLKLRDIKGKSIFDLVGKMLSQEDAEKINARMQFSYETGRAQTYIEKISFYDRATWWKTSLHPIMNEVGDIYRIIGSSVEITELKETEQKLQDSENFLSAVVESSLCGLYIYDLTTSKNVFINNRYTEITGYSEQDFQSMDDMHALFHPDDMQQVVEHMQKVMDSDKGYESLEYRFLHKSGHWIWCYSYDLVFRRNEAGEATQMLGSFINITDIKNSQEGDV